MPIKKTIEIGCPPGGVRPNHILKAALKGTELPVLPDCGRSFGDWTFDYTSVQDDVWFVWAATVFENLGTAYDNGWIRYAMVHPQSMEDVEDETDGKGK
jgi:hypothetical protein